MDFIDIYKAFYPTVAEYTFFSCARGIFSRIDHMLGHKTSLSKFKKIEITPSIFSDLKTLRLEVSYKKKNPTKNTNTWCLNNVLLNNQCIPGEIKQENKNTWRQI